MFAVPLEVHAKINVVLLIQVHVLLEGAELCETLRAPEGSEVSASFGFRCSESARAPLDLEESRCSSLEVILLQREFLSR